MPLPLPIMIPFMMWQSAAIAAGFGTYFQFAKRKVSAMSNEEFNNANPHDLVDALYADIVKNIPSSFKQIESLTPIILDSMLKMLTDAAQWFSQILGGTGGPADLAHHLQGLPGHVGHGPFFGEDFDTTPDTTTDTPTSFTPDVPGQASIPSVAWLNNLSRAQLKAIRNDALRGDYNASSKKLILARYKQIFEFDNPEQTPFTPGTPIGSLTFKHPSSSMFRNIHPLVAKRILAFGEGDLNLIFKLLANQFATAKNMIDNGRSSVIISNGKKLKTAVTALIAWYNKFIPSR